MDSTVRIELWHGGRFDEQYNNFYIGGEKFVVPDVDLDRFCLDDLFDMLKAAGGQQMNVDFFFQLPKNSFAARMVKIVGDAEIRTMCNCFRNHSAITLWSQENNYIPKKVIFPENTLDEDESIGAGCNPGGNTKAGPQEMNATDENEGGTNESFGSDPIDDDDIGLDGVSIGDDEDSLDGSFHESDEGVGSESSTEIDARDDRTIRQPDPRNEEATECWYSDIGLEDELVSLASSDDDDSGPKHPVFSERMNMKSFELVVGMKFKDVHEFRSVLADWTVRSGVELSFIKNEKRRVTALCKAGCDWRLHASLVMGGPTFQIKTLTGGHTCVRASSNKLATYKYLSKRIEMIVCENPTIPVDKLKGIIRRKCNVEVSKYKAYRAKKAALEKFKGKFKDQYLKLWDYCDTVRKYNPGSKMLVKRDHSFSVPTFQRMYFSLEALKSGFLAGCRPIIGLDGCFLKTNYGGQLLVAIGRDGNDNIFPISMAVVQVENFDNWRWFLSELLEDIGFGRWTFISDRQKGLLEALNELTLECEHRFCVRHLYQNFARKHPGVELRGMLWAAASTTNKNEFAMWMKRIEIADRKTSPDYETAAEWLNKIPVAHWARSHFPISSFSDVIVNNMTEFFNSYILEARDMPIISIFEWIRTKLMTRIQLKREGMEKYVGEICPNIVKRLNEHEQRGRNCSAFFCGMMEYQIQTPNGQYVVDLAKKECSCRRFQLCGYPCLHACVAIREHRMQITEFVHQYYKKEAYLRTYSHMIHAVPGEDDYCKTEYEPLGPPEVKKRAGRPKKKRRKGIDEVQKTTSTRQRLTHTCSNCLETGHNKSSCTNRTHERSRCYQGSSRIQSRGRRKNTSQHSRTPFTQGTTPTGPHRGATSTPVSRHSSPSSIPFQAQSTSVSRQPPSSSQREQSSSAQQPPNARSRNHSANSTTAHANSAIAHASANAKASERSSATTSARTIANERASATANAMASAFASASASASASANASVSANANAACGRNMQNTAAQKITISEVLENIRKKAKERGGLFRRG